MFDRFSDGARNVMGLARKEAERLNHDYLGTEHILLAIAAAECAASSVLEAMGVSAVRIREAVERIVKPGPTMVSMGQLPLTPRAKKALEFALEEAGTAEGARVGTTQLLLGCLREDSGGAAQVLKELGVTLTALRAHLRAPHRATEVTGASAAEEVELTEGMCAIFRQPNGNVLEILVENGLLFVTDGADHARLGVTLRPHIQHILQINSWSDPPEETGLPKG